MKGELGELVSVRVQNSGYVGGPSALILHLELSVSDKSPTYLRLRGVESVDDLILKLVAARNKAWPWPPLVIAQHGEVRP